MLRHNAARNLTSSFAAAAGFNPELERPGLLPPRPDDVRVSGRRPADVYIPSWFHGAPAAFDFAVSSPHRQAARILAMQGVGCAAQEYEMVKRSHTTSPKLRCIACGGCGLDFASGDMRARSTEALTTSASLR